MTHSPNCVREGVGVTFENAIACTSSILPVCGSKKQTDSGMGLLRYRWSTRESDAICDKNNPAHLQMLARRTEKVPSAREPDLLLHKSLQWLKKNVVFLISLRILIFFISLFHRQVLRLMQTGVRFIQEIRPYSLNLSDVEHDLWLDSSWTQSIHHSFILFFQQSFQWSEIQRRKLPECESIVPRRTVCLCHNSSR